MSYNLEKYRAKREKVLGLRRRGPSFAQLVSFFAAAVFMIMGVVIIPQAIAFFQTRNLDDAIYKPSAGSQWTAGKSDIVLGVPGVQNVVEETQSGRLIVTFDRTITSADKISTTLAGNGPTVVLLNVVGHRERLKITQKEQAFEAL